MGITVYSSPGCGVCNAVKHYLHSKGVRYKEFDVSRDPEALQEMLDLTGGARTLPVTVIADDTVVGFDRDRMEALLEAQG